MVTFFETLWKLDAVLDAANKKGGKGPGAEPYARKKEGRKFLPLGSAFYGLTTISPRRFKLQASSL